ncbi:C-type lectin domain family 17, member A-like [Penaeus vannamei]|uniref:C-type lectin domain family 17, member A-like n=1 Tax=Penaeus vannamei TaxID=6689 RepID=UPI00387F4E4F
MRGVVAAFVWAVAGAAWALEEGGVGSLYDGHFPPLHPNCTQSLTDLLLLRQEVQLREIKQAEEESTGVLREMVDILTDIRGSLTWLRTSTETPCPGNFIRFGGTCLYLAKDTFVTWQVARVFCQDLGGDLAVFRDANAFAEAIGYAKASGLSNPAHVWVGGSDVSLEGEWKWLNGEDMPRGTPFWGDYNYAREPRGELRENCANLFSNDGFLIHDVSCDSKYNPLCQIKNT